MIAKLQTSEWQKWHSTTSPTLEPRQQAKAMAAISETAQRLLHYWGCWQTNKWRGWSIRHCRSWLGSQEQFLNSQQDLQCKKLALNIFKLSHILPVLHTATAEVHPHQIPRHDHILVPSRVVVCKARHHVLGDFGLQVTFQDKSSNLGNEGDDEKGTIGIY